MSTGSTTRGWLQLTRAEARLAAGAALLFAVLAVDLSVGALVADLDAQARDRVVTGSPPGWLAPFGALGDLGVAIPVVVATAAVASQAIWRWWPAVFAFGLFGAVQLAVLTSKWVVGRPGPGVWADREGYPGYFPSGHTATAMTAVAIAVFLALRLHRRDTSPPAVWWALGCGLVAGAGAGAQAVASDTHWVGDVVGGLALAATLLVLGCGVARARVSPVDAAAEEL